MNGRLYVTNDAKLSGDLNVMGITNLYSDVNVTGNISTIDGSMNAKYLTITNTSTFQNDVTITSGNINMTNVLSFINQF
jgi:hypothetical protein